MAIELQHRWSLGHNYLAGITADAWWRLLRQNRFAIDPAYWHRGIFISFLSLMSSRYRRQEERRYGAAALRHRRLVHLSAEARSLQAR